jgi:hypothetical protein
MLAAVAASYGRDSAEYEMAGGSKRMSRRRVTVSTAPLTTSPESPASVAFSPDAGSATEAMA